MPAEGPWIASFRTRGLAAEIQGLTDLQALRVREDLRLMPLQLDARSLLEDLPALGPVDYTTGNGSATCTRHEQVREVLPLDGGTVLFGDDAGMRWLNASWRHSVAVLSQGRDFVKSPPCLLLFGETGELAHQITLPDPSTWEGFIDLVCQHQGCWTCLRHGLNHFGSVSKEECPAWLLREAWREAGTNQDLDARLARLGVPRLLALRAMEGLHTTALDTQDLAAVLREFVSTGLPLHVELGNRHCIEVMEAPLERFEEGSDGWDLQLSRSALHLDPSRIASLWCVVPPWQEKEQHRFECYDEAGEQVLSLCCPLNQGPAVERDWQRIIGRVEARLP